MIQSTTQWQGNEAKIGGCTRIYLWWCSDAKISAEYKDDGIGQDISGNLPALIPDQVRKLKKLSVLTLAESTKIKMIAIPTAAANSTYGHIGQLVFAGVGGDDDFVGDGG
uniref:Uncharacterized protein n=1 Tax=Oryza meridionalis TaxID=40149 RepID=A0A0E0EH83_9ORYZ